MPWKETDAMDQRMRFIIDHRSGTMSMTALCRVYGIARSTAYKWLARFEERRRFADLADRSRRPHSSPLTVAADIEARLVAARRRHPLWGPRKLRSWLVRQDRRFKWPAPSTIGEVLRRHKLINKRRLRPRMPPRTQPFAQCLAPNDVWCVDFKGHFRTGDGCYCYPLTVMDAYSRYLLGCTAMDSPDLCSVHTAFESLFRRYGLPAAIRSDNGLPFVAAQAPAGLSRLSAWWVKLGIRLERIDPGKPYQNGRHERMHLTLKLETASPPASNMQSQQRAFDRFRRIYNHERPHEALDQHPPASKYEASTRSLPARLLHFAPPFAELRLVERDGKISWGKGRLFISNSLAGEVIALERIADRYWEVTFGPITLGFLDLEQRSYGLMRPKSDRRSPTLSAMSPV